MTVNGHKRCPQCKLWKPATTKYFPVLRSRCDGLRPQCRVCHNLNTRLYDVRLAQAEGTHTRADIEFQYAAQQGRCFWCDKPVGSEWHADHRVPIARGGGNGPDNIVIACPHCNMSKGSLLPDEFLARRTTALTWRGESSTIGGEHGRTH